MSTSAGCLEPPPLPSRRLRLFASTARWALRLVAGVWLALLLVWAGLHWVLIPRIAHWGAPLERWASQALGQSVEIGRLHARSGGLFPAIELHDVRLWPAQQPRPADGAGLHLQQVVVTVSPRSLLRGGLEQLYIHAPQLQVQRLADGRWRIAGHTLGEGDAPAADYSQALQWLLTQPELALRGGSLHWQDDSQPEQPYAQYWQSIDLVLRAQGRRHALRLDAQDAQGQSLHLAGILHSPLALPLPGQAPQPLWQQWRGQWFAQWQLYALPPLPWSQWGLSNAVEQVQAAGQGRLWLTVEGSEITHAHSDWALQQVNIAWANPQAAPLALRQVQTRLTAERKKASKGWVLRASGLGFDWLPHGDDGQAAPQHWLATDIEWQTNSAQQQYQLRVALSNPAPTPAKQHSLPQGMDIALLRELLLGLPLPALADWQAPLQRWQPEGQLEFLEAQWQSGQPQSDPSASHPYQARGQLWGLGLASQPASTVGIPGVQGLDVAFSLSEAGGQASLAMQQGVLDFPGVFEEPKLPLDSLSAQLHWQPQVEGGWQVAVDAAQFANADAQGAFSGSWRSSPDEGDGDKGSDPGILQLQGSLAQANGARVHRYLPLSIPAEVRHYVRDSVLAGQGRDVRFEVAGALHDMPFRQPGSGRFHITAPVHAVDYDYLPASWMEAGQAPWPPLRQLAGVLEFDGQGMRVRQAQTQVQAVEPTKASRHLVPASVAFEQVQAEIADWHKPVVQVQGRSQDALASMLQVLRATAIEDLTEHVLAPAQAQGQAVLDLQLSIPLEEPEHSLVKGSVQLRGNQLQLRPDVPLLTQLQGRVDFYEQGFALEDVQAQALGGAVQLSGGMAHLASGVRVQAQGQASAQGLGQGIKLAVVQALVAQAQGQASYQLLLQSQGGAPEIEVQSDLRGLALDLPAPLGKAASSARPLVVRYQPAGQGKSGTVDSLEVALSSADGGEDGHLRYLLDSHSGQARAGWLYWGAAAQQRPNTLSIADGVQAQVQTHHVDMDAWAEQISQFAAWADRDEASPAPASAAEPELAPWRSFLPQRLQLQAEQLHWQQRQLHQVQAQMSQQQGRWRGQIQAQELTGYVDYQPQHPYSPAGLVFVRLEHLHIPPAPPAAASAEAAPEMLAATEPEPGEPINSTSNGADTWPALDIHVQALQVADKDLGQLFVRARPQSQHTRWALERFELRSPEARWRAQGWWQAASTGSGQAAERTALQFTLEAQDAGQLLTRLGMAGVLQQGKGDISGQMQWQGSPLQPHWPSMQGQVALAMGRGQFLKAEPGMAKLLSVLSLQSIGKRLSGDFRDIFSSGFAFDFVRGDIDIAQGIARTNNLQMQGLNAAVLMEGEANLQAQTQALRLVIVPEINAMTASLVASAINPLVGLGSFLAQALLRKPMMAVATREFIVSGSWADPVVRPASASPSSTTDTITHHKEP